MLFIRATLNFALFKIDLKKREVVASGIPILTAITFDKDGRLWATKNSLIPGQAEVIEISL